MNEAQEIFREFGANPAYRHLLLNHLPIIGLAVGALALFFALFLGRGARVAALLVVLLTAGSVFPVYETGEEAYRPIRRIADDAGVDWLDAHMDRADAGVRYYYALAGLALVALVLPVKWPRTGGPLAALTLAGAVFCVGVGGWIAQAGGPIRHAELRPAPAADDTVMPP